jgi:hypothetical protein
MKHNFILFLLLLSFQTFAQGFYSKIMNPSDQLTSASEGLIKDQDDIIFFNRGFCPINEDSFYECASLVRCNQSGSESQRKVLQGIFLDHELIAIGDSLIALVHNYYGNNVDEFRNTDSLQLSLIDIKTFEIKNQILLYNNLQKYNYNILNILKYKNKYVISVMAAFGSNYVQNGKQKLYPHLIWVNENMTLDTIIKIDLPYGEIYQMAVDQNGNLNAMVTQRTIEVLANSTEKIEEYKGYVVYSDQKEMIKSKLVRVNQSNYHSLLQPYHILSKFLPDGRKVFVAERFDVNNTEIHCWDKDDNLLWLNKEFWRDEYAHSPSDIILCKNGDIIHAGSASRSGMRTCGYIHRITPDGKTKWIRYYGYNFAGLQNRSLKNILNDIKEYEDGSLLAIGTITNEYVNHATHPVKNDSTWIFKVDSLGCMEGNKCNDEYLWNGPDDWFQYDQLTLKHKEWNFQQTKSDGMATHILQRFGQDTTMYDKNLLPFLKTGSGWARYKPVITKDMNTGEETQDSIYVSWMKEGRVFGLISKNCLQCRNHVMLYDFTLKLHDTFTLPYDFGKVKVHQVDSISFLQGYLRKRIILKHLDPANQTKYGDLVWIEGIGSPNGILYYNDWKQNSKTQLTCYYERGEKRFSTTGNPDCRIVQQSDEYLKVLLPENVWYTFWGNGFSGDIFYSRNTISKDSFLIRDKYYYKVLYSMDSTAATWSHKGIFTRESDGKLWVLDSLVSNDEVLIMDMNLSKNDTFYYKAWGEDYKFVVEKKDTIVDLAGQMRKVSYMRCADGESINFRWIEGIGPDMGVFEANFQHCLIDGFPVFLTCFYNSDVQHWKTDYTERCWESSLQILQRDYVRYVLTRQTSGPVEKMERWQFKFPPGWLNNKAYYELLISNEKNGTDFQRSGKFFRSEKNRFYQYISPSQGERLLYDMNLKTGDSIRLQNDEGWSTLVVLYTDSIQLSDQRNRKRLTLQCLNNITSGHGKTVEWIEGIGSYNDPFMPFSHCSEDNALQQQTLCIFEGIKEIYKSEDAPDDCWIDDFSATDMTPEATWHLSSYIGDDWVSGDCRRAIYTIKVARDTMICDLSCRIIGIDNGVTFFSESELIVFSKENRMYFYADGIWRLLYDFNAKQGDTVTYFLPRNYHYYSRYSIHAPFEDYIYQLNPYKLRIESVDTIYDRFNQPLKRFHTQSLSEIFSSITMGTIIENMGSTDGLFGNTAYISLPECTEFTGPRCYLDGSNFIQLIDGDCDNLVNVRDIVPTAPYIYPNPTNSSFTIEAGKEMRALSIYDLYGNKYRDIKVQDSGRIVININSVPSGVYILKLKFSDSSVQSLRLVKSD